jgi:site-specific recombinase XerD
MTENEVSVLADLTPLISLEAALDGKSKQTQRNYAATARRFLLYLQSKGVAFDHAGAEELRAFVHDYKLKWHQSHRPSPGEETPPDPNTTLAAYTAAVLALFRANGVKVDEEKLAHFRMPQQDPKTLTPDLVKMLLRCAMAGPNPARNGAMITILAHSGLRLSELTALTRESLIDGPDGHLQALQVRSGKGRKDRVVPLLDPVAVEDAINTYLKEHKEVRGSKRLFPLSPTTVERAITNVASLLDEIRRSNGEDSDIASWLHPHSLRHSLATDLLRRDVNMEAVRKMLGHTSLATTQKYLHLVDDDVLKAVQAARGKGE